MPARPYRRRELHDHATRQAASAPPDLHAARRRHPGWPRCPRCRYPVDPAAGGTHPHCYPEAPPA